ncbi:MAG TPA: SDR family oxidoreductase, partial [Terriglobia bacterium]|nr:SDR family oxidoreductase [Terriglobia bacterium]
QLVILPSSCAVYGNTGPEPAEPMRTKPSPLSIYGLSKVLAEQILTMWARDSGNTAMILRVGNVVGRGCGGLIPYLVHHAVRNQDPVVPARMRGAGRIVRDYVPVDYVSQAMLAAAEQRLPSGTALTLNVGSGEGMTNREVAEIVRAVLGLHGYVLTIEWQTEPAYGEALIALLDVKQTEQRLGLERPSRVSVHRVIEEAALHCLEVGTRRQESQRSVTTYPLPASAG